MFVVILGSLALCNAATMFPFEDLWSFCENATAVADANWPAYFFDDTGWPMGYGSFGAGVSAYTPLNLTRADEATPVTTYYFRKVRCCNLCVLRPPIRLMFELCRNSMHFCHPLV
jgi:hypothetical protein